MASLSLYPIKYLNEFFAPYGSSLETNILSTSMSSILVTFLFLQKSLFYFFVSKVYVLSTHSYIWWKKVKFCYNNLGSQRIVAYFKVVLNGLVWLWFIKFGKV